MRGTMPVCLSERHRQALRRGPNEAEPPLLEPALTPCSRATAFARPALEHGPLARNPDARTPDMRATNIESHQQRRHASNSDASCARGGAQLLIDRTTAPTSGLVTEVTRSPLPSSQRFIRARATPRAPTWVPAGPSENVADVTDRTRGDRPPGRPPLARFSSDSPTDVF